MTRTEIVDAVMAAYHSRYPRTHTERLYTCKAEIIYVDFSDWLVLKSYSTVVAAFQYSTGILWVFGFYSNTTAQHIAKFKNWIRFEYCTGWNWPKIVRLYNDSRTGKRAAKKNLEDDFASVIATALNQPRFIQ